ncbi:MAG: diguanylate cyclase [Nitrospinaceae bacterium]
MWDEKKQLKILLIEDSPEDRKWYKRLLARGWKFDFSLLEAGTGEKGLDLCRKERPDCILLDYMLPDINGLEFISQLKEIPYAGGVILLTGQGSEMLAVKAMKEGTHDYLVKDSLTPESLTGAIMQALEHVRLNERRKQGEEKLKSYTAELKRSNYIKDELIQELKNLKRKLEITAKTDPLTGLSNRREMEDKLNSEKVRFERYKKPFSVIMADIDDFKKINDSYGHNAGDHVLIEVGKMFKNNCRKQDLVCRWGGEEFLIFLPETNLEGGVILAKKLQRLVEGKILSYRQKPLRITLSFGVSVYQDEMDLECCLRLADECLYEAKDKGKNQVCFVTDKEPIRTQSP